MASLGSAFASPDPYFCSISSHWIPRLIETKNHKTNFLLQLTLIGGPAIITPIVIMIIIIAMIIVAGKLPTLPAKEDSENIKNTEYTDIKNSVKSG